MPINSSETSKLDLGNIHHSSNNNSILSVDIIDTSNFSIVANNTSNFTIAANNDFTTNLSYSFNQSICLFDNLYFEKKESNILIINYTKAFIWDENVSGFKIIDVEKFDYNLIETDEKHDSISNNVTFNSLFTNSAQIFLTLLLEQNDMVLIDTEKNKNYKFCSKIKKWILLDRKSFFNIEFDNNIKIFDIKRDNNTKELLVEKKRQIKFYEGFVFVPYITTTNNNVITVDPTIFDNYINTNLNNRIYSRYYNLGIDTANNYITSSLSYT
jgi:hypothetical protein